MGQNCVSFLGPAQKDSNIINEILNYYALCEEGVFIPIINTKKIKVIKKMPSVSNQSDVAEAIAKAGIVDLTPGFKSQTKTWYRCSQVQKGSVAFAVKF